MKNRGSKLLVGIGVLICCTSSVFATQTAQLTLTGVAGPTLGGVYTSPYYGTIKTGNTTETNVAIICDDFASDTYLGESWTAAVSKLPNLSSPPAKWSSGFTASKSGAGVWSLGANSLTLAQAYTTAAYLATQILIQQQLGNTTLQGEYSFALWTLFDGQAPLNAIPSEAQKVMALLAGAELTTQNQSLSDYSNVTIYSYDSTGGLPTGCGGTCPPPPQEFIRVSMAEPSSPAVLAVDLFGVIGLMVVFRRRLVGIFN